MSDLGFVLENALREADGSPSTDPQGSRTRSLQASAPGSLGGGGPHAQQTNET